MISNFFSRFWGGVTPLTGLPYLGTELRNLTTSSTKLNPESLAATRRCVGLLSDGICSSNLQMVRNLETGGKEVITDSPTAKALRRLRYAELELVLSDLLFLGNGFLQVVKTGSRIRFKAIPAWRVSIAIDGSGGVYYQISKDSNVNLPEETLRPWEIIHLRYRVDQTNPLIGVSPLRLVSGSISAIVETYHLQQALSKNLANAGIILATDLTLNAEQTQKLRTSINEKSQSFMAGGSVILSHGIKPVQSHITQSIKDQELVEAMRFSVEEVSRIYGVPPSMLGYSQHTSFATAQEERRAFLTNTLKPLMIRIADGFTETLLSDEEIDSGVSLEFDASDFGAGKELSETLGSLINSGVMTVNEARNRIGLPDINGGDVARSPTNVMPIDSWLTYYETNNNGINNNGN